MIIRPTNDNDLRFISAIHESAFPDEDVERLTIELLKDPTAVPYVSLIAFVDEKPVGHILFTRAIISEQEDISISILAPLGVVPGAQGSGVGGALVEEGIKILTERDTDLVLVLGHPGYYPRFGFKPAKPFGISAPYPIPDEVSDAWMVKGLRDGVLNNVSGQVSCADALMKPEHWRE